MEREIIKLKELPEDIAECIRYDDSYKEKGLEFIEKGKWISDGKYDYKTSIFKYNGKYWKYSCSRTGSYYSEYEHYLDGEAKEVFPKEKTITVYE